MATITLICHNAAATLPPEGAAILVFHAGGVDRGCRYGQVWRHAEYGEDQLYGVTHWSDLPESPAD
jgi:hypothetical protein